MTRKISACKILLSAIAAVTLAGSSALAQSAPPRSLPVFEVDKAWPNVPPQMKLGHASSFAIDAQDNVWLLQRPRTLKPEDTAKAAPPVVVFAAAGNFIKAWGGDGTGFDWP